MDGAWTKRRRHVVRAACFEFVFDFVFSFLVETHFAPSRDKVKDVRFCTGVRVNLLCWYSSKPNRNNAVINSPTGTFNPSSDDSADSLRLSSGEKPRQVVITRHNTSGFCLEPLERDGAGMES